jgi:hypothetical protein
MQSYRAEGYGRMSPLLFFYSFHFLLRQFQSPSDRRSIPYSGYRFVKLVLEARSELRKKSPSRLVSLHVRGHQDDEYDYDDLTRPEQLNALADGQCHDWLPVGIRESQRGATTDIYPQCNQPVTLPYVYLC